MFSETGVTLQVRELTFQHLYELPLRGELNVDIDPVPSGPSCKPVSWTASDMMCPNNRFRLVGVVTPIRIKKPSVKRTRTVMWTPLRYVLSG